MAAILSPYLGRSSPGLDVTISVFPSSDSMSAGFHAVPERMSESKLTTEIYVRFGIVINSDRRHPFRSPRMRRNYEILIETMAYMGRADGGRNLWVPTELGFYIHIGIISSWLRAVRLR
jgi:hypothetical protein